MDSNGVWVLQIQNWFQKSQDGRQCKGAQPSNFYFLQKSNSSWVGVALKNYKSSGKDSGLDIALHIWDGLEVGWVLINYSWPSNARIGFMHILYGLVMGWVMIHIKSWVESMARTHLFDFLHHTILSYLKMLIVHVANYEWPLCRSIHLLVDCIKLIVHV